MKRRNAFYLIAAIAYGYNTESFTIDYTEKSRLIRCEQTGGMHLGWPSTSRRLTLISTECFAHNGISDGDKKAAELLKLTPEVKELEDILKHKQETGKLLVAQTAPSVRVAFSELFGEEPGMYSSGILVASLKALGFDIVLDTNTGADLTICEEGTELLRRITLRQERPMKEMEDPSFPVTSEIDNPLPLFTSCCPGWMNFIAKENPELIPYVSSCKSPHMMLGAM